jgi:translation initiation factor 2 alpha subunit (eIF-2alpha)
MGKILNYSNDIGCEVQLLEYDVVALLPISDFSSKKIKKPLGSFFKIDEEVPVMISNMSDDFITVSAKDVSELDSVKCIEEYASRARLLKMSKRLAYLSGGTLTEKEWTVFFREKLDSQADIFNYDVITNKEKFSKIPSSPYIDVIAANYIELFGIQTVTSTADITIQSFAMEGDTLVKSALAKTLKKFQPMEKGKKYTKEELYNDTTLFNIDLMIVLPVFSVSVTACDRDVCDTTLERFCKAVEAHKFDHYKTSLTKTV